MSLLIDKMELQKAYLDILFFGRRKSLYTFVLIKINYGKKKIWKNELGSE